MYYSTLLWQNSNLMQSKIKKELRIVFMGTPEFAVPSLKILVDHGYNVVGVITATDKYGGRGGKQLIESDVKKYAQSQNLTILQPPNLKDQEFLESLKALNANLQIVVAFRMLPTVVWDMPEYGTYNLHGSLLPKYRGAAPINWAIINGEKETGVTSFKLKHEIDTGDLLFQEKCPIGPDETVGEVYEKLKVLGAKVVLKTVKAIEEDNVTLHPQDNSNVSKAPKIQKETCEIDLSKSGEDIHNFVRGLNPYPGAWIDFFGYQMKIFRVTAEPCIHNIAIGKIESDNKNYLKIAISDGWIHLSDVQLQGKKRMDIKSLLNGMDISEFIKND